jgi:hypothetical protein
MGREGSFHHLIALFCTVAAISGDSKPEGTIICNEIKHLERKRKALFRKYLSFTST